MNSVLVIDDDVFVGAIIAEMLRAGGLLPSVSTSGIEGIALAKLNHPSTIVLDICMPGMSGYEVANALKNDRDTNGIPIVFLTGLTGPADRIRAFKVGGDAVLIKPVEPSDLLGAIRGVKRVSLVEKTVDIGKVILLQLPGLEAVVNILLISSKGSFQPRHGLLDKLVQIVITDRIQKILHSVPRKASIYRFWWTLNTSYILVPPTIMDIIGHN